MKKYLIETEVVHKIQYVFEAENEEEAMKIKEKRMYFKGQQVGPSRYVRTVKVNDPTCIEGMCA